MGKKLDKALDEGKITFKKIDKIMSGAFLYYSAICGFIFGWFSLAVILYTISGEIPAAFLLLLRLFYFLLSFIVGIKIIIFLLNLFIRKT